jgi:hypothetical protein
MCEPRTVAVHMIEIGNLKLEIGKKRKHPSKILYILDVMKHAEKQSVLLRFIKFPISNFQLL